MLIQIFTEPDMMSFVHADMHVSRCEVFGKRRKNAFDKRIRLFIINQQDIINIGYFGKTRQFHRIGKMSERLNARYEFYSLRFCIFIHLSDFRARITPAQIPKIRFICYLESIFRIQFKRIITHDLQNIY